MSPWYTLPPAPGRKNLQKNSNWKTPDIRGPNGLPIENVPVNPMEPIPVVGNGPTPPSIPVTPSGGKENVRPLKRGK